MSGVRLSRAYLPGMPKKNWGRIVFISSESARHRGECRRHRYNRELVLPGPTHSEGVLDFFGKLAKEANMSEAEFEKEFVAKNRP